MPFYTIYIVLNPGAKEDTEIEFEGNVIKELKLLIPPGHQAKCGIAFLYGSEWIAPRESNTYIKGDGQTLIIPVDFVFPGKRTNKLRIKAYSDATKYPHTFYIYLTTGYIEEQPDYSLINKAAELLIKLVSKFGIRGT
jgi:hypothetical protein